jgi:hypothetical protein
MHYELMHYEPSNCMCAVCGKQTNPLMRMVNEIDEGNKGGALHTKEIGRGAP